MLNHPQREAGPLASRDKLHQMSLDLLRVALLAEPESSRYALHVRIDRDTLILVERRAQDDIRGLSTDPGELHQLVHRVGHHPRVVGDQRLRE